ncbi:hypothetical protein E2R51_03970 [Jeotgalibacillus sp. S-D1]|uniref:DUF6241 domain-containing protein n=1 Tax=Jeotgalibacillus sp. S-D1 TaxID=2552189 RepID=UPI001059A4C3|nr:DUF6241 domain-containing protein [Jeotgalibacillus sp. S-D1]TDL34889.1 hypothetical protein E2R51_03970 [Jeotgalibacillus sp. S-D1]
MGMMKKTSLIAAGAFLLLVGTIIGTYLWFSQDQAGSEINEAEVSGEEMSKEDAEQLLEESRPFSAGTITDEDLEQYEKEGLNPFKQKVSKNELKDYHYQEYIHGMSHQKVKAKKKWGFYEIHPARIQWLLDGLDESAQIKDKSIYRNILEKWAAGDFSRVDDDHNKIWKMQDGTVGEATGILSEKEEKKYVDKMAP